MNLACKFVGQDLCLMASGALFWPSNRMLVISDLHLGKSERIARRSGMMLPPYDTTETLTRLAHDIEQTNPGTVLCLGDSFDDCAAAESLDDAHRSAIGTLQKGRRWLWIEGNHDPGPVGISGTNLSEFSLDTLTFRHIAQTPTVPGEVSGHYHPKARIRATSRPCFLVDNQRLMLPAYGCYTGGLNWTTPTLRSLFADKATAYLTGPKLLAVPVPRAA